MFYSNTLNLIQVCGGTQVKQGDLGSRFSYKLANEKEQELDNFDKEVAHINLVLDDKIVFTTTATVDNSTVTFNIDKAIPIGLYFLEIKIRDYIFPSDKQTIIFVQSGAVAYDLKDLVPNYNINMTLKDILSDLSQKGIDISDLNRRMAEKVNKDEVTNVMTPKGTLAYASLPSTGNEVGWYYYCPDGDGTHGAGNYVWNGSSWYFGGTGDEGYNLLKEDLDDLEECVTDIITLSPTVLNGFFNSNTGLFTSNASYFSYKIEVKEHEKYYLTGKVEQDAGFCLSLLLDENESIVKVIHKGNYTEVQHIQDELVVIPTGVKYLTLTSKIPYQESFNLKKVEFLDIKKTIEDVEKIKLLNHFEGKVIVNFGDSIIGNFRPPVDISTKLASLTGATVYNCGFGGCRMGKHTETHFDKFSMYQIVNALKSNDWTAQDSAVSETGWGMPAYFTETLATLKNIDFSNVDIITIEYGTNDWTGLHLDNPNNEYDVNYFCGALRYCLENLYELYPHIKIFLWTPTYRFFMDSEYQFVSDSDSDNYVQEAVGYSLPQLVEKEKEIAKQYHTPIIDNYFELGINKFNRTNYFPSNDGTHPNEKGRELIASHVARKLW